MAFPVRASAQPVKGFTSWSFSRLSAHELCPLKAKLSMIDKIPEPQKPALKRGDEIHQLAQKYITGAHAKMAPELLLFKALFKSLRRDHAKDPESVVVESSWAFRRDWSSTTYDDWKEAWLRIKVDVARVRPDHVDVIDWKTGKFSPQFNLVDYLEQIELYALGGLLLYQRPVTPRLVYLDQGVVFPEEKHELERTYTPDDVPELRKKWEAKVKPMLADRKFAPKPNKWCYNCWYRKDNKANGGGQCQY